MTRIIKCTRLAFAVLALAANGTAAAQAVSKAETLLFETDHLARLPVPASLVYDFSRVGNVAPAFSGQVRLDLANDKGKPSASLHFLSGKHEFVVPAVDEPHGNPVLLGFLERDIGEMKRLTGGATNYFRKRIRLALAEAAQLSAVPITYGGKKLQAQAVSIQPYLNDPLHARFEKYLRKTYTFVVSEQVPGGVYLLRTSLGNPAANTAAGAPVIDETLTLVKVAHPKR
jgi:hypothetical protein